MIGYAKSGHIGIMTDDIIQRRRPGRPRGAGLPRRTAKYEVQRLSHGHRAILEYVVKNPDCTNKQIAAAFQRSPEWIGMLIRTDLFQEALDRAMDQSLTMHAIPLRQKLMGAAHMAVEKLGTKINSSEDPNFILAAADKTLHRLGYAPTRGPEAAVEQNVAQQNVFVVDPETLRVARDRLASLNKPALPAGEQGEICLENE